MRNDDQLIAHFITSVTGINSLLEPIEVHVIIKRTTEMEVDAVNAKSAVPDYGTVSTPYIHTITTSLSEANKQGLDNLAYWRNGVKASKVYIHNQALAQYLAQYRESQRPIPEDINE